MTHLPLSFPANVSHRSLFGKPPLDFLEPWTGPEGTVTVMEPARVISQPAPEHSPFAVRASKSDDIVRVGHVYRETHPPKIDHDDTELVRLVCDRKDSHAGGMLFDRYAPLVRRILVRTLGPFYEVEDQVQDTFVAFFRQVETLKNTDALRAFLVSITVRTARHELRRRRVRRVLHLAPPEEIAEAAPAGREPDHDGREALRRLFAILDDLDTASRLVFTLRYLEEMELMEVAVAVGESLASVKRRLARIVPVVNARARRDEALAPYLGLAPQPPVGVPQPPLGVPQPPRAARSERGREVLKSEVARGHE
jgi:RNA polymerase sigma-70 factor (ECF subfamily)